MKVLRWVCIVLCAWPAIVLAQTQTQAIERSSISWCKANTVDVGLTVGIAPNWEALQTHIFAKKCLFCHGFTQFSTYEEMTYPPRENILPGRYSSRKRIPVLAAIAGCSMPLRGSKVSFEDLSVVTEWIQSGFPEFPGERIPVDDRIGPFDLVPADVGGDPTLRSRIYLWFTDAEQSFQQQLFQKMEKAAAVPELADYIRVATFEGIAYGSTGTMIRIILRSGNEHLKCVSKRKSPTSTAEYACAIRKHVAGFSPVGEGGAQTFEPSPDPTSFAGLLETVLSEGGLTDARLEADSPRPFGSPEAFSNTIECERTNADVACSASWPSAVMVD